ncbi:MAG TPA: DNA alkylation repair protein [Acidobacteriota bacterium]|nr:DNA alkylation repair protein [Acidobacteriota bacterium]
MKQTYDGVIRTLRREIARHDKPENRLDYQRFFKEPLDEPTGLKIPVLRKISSQCFKELKGAPAKDVLACCDDLLASDERYMRFFAFEWALKLRNQYRPQDFTRFESWLKRYVNNWGTCDHFCCGPVGHLVFQFPELASKTYRWARSRDRWRRRAAAVSLIVPVRKRLLLDEVFRTADALLIDRDDMVQKGYGWMLKEASNVFPDEIFAYVMKHRSRMPRTALRYAIEKLPPAKRKQAMKKDF